MVNTNKSATTGYPEPRLAETPECWSLEFHLIATFADNFDHISRQNVSIHLETIFIEHTYNSNAVFKQ